ncbi:LacI family DNA-binding transcriptional regulator [Microbacterium sp. ET2]|uniref:LacI family DNA-binding transcriptional regulator n=1 Tax=Microbacterium albipurpureum TaxID=3050384 RepID=UPI00259D2168|nr:LacI family DNA-binding transcriptional regulator [Microbacterium sp. ET2 (Ac-2212)]WJL97016.1 LacI family DNA-binding transcriptional regulator [Microbacterium sp. ET2 (Ac-2212)]
MATLSDVAARAGVSVSAASRVLSDAPNARVSDDTRRRITEAAQELDYRPNFAARALKFSRTNVIGLIVPDLTNAIFTELMRGVEEEATRRGYMVLLARIEGMPEGQEAIPRLIGEGRVDGVLLQVGDTMRPEDLKILVEESLPIVLVNSTNPQSAGSVVLDDDLGANLGTRHLIDFGHTRIALISGHPASDTATRRERGFRAAMADARLDVPEEYVTRLGYEPRNGGLALAALAALPEPPTAVMVANINAAHGALLEARRLGLRVPGELSIVAMHDAWTAENAWPPLTTVRMPLYELGREAMSAIHDRITSGTIADVVVRDPKPFVVVRESTAPPSV